MRRISFDNSGDFLSWWFESERLTGYASKTFNRYYSNYRKNFYGYLKKIWSDRHSELDREIDRLKDRSNPKILDLGCGTGSISLYIAYKLRDKSEVLGVDVRDDRLFCAKKRKDTLENELGFILNCVYRKVHVLDLDEKKKFDLIYLEEALHHMEPRVRVVEIISNLMKKDGTLIVSETNAYNPFVQLHVFKKRGFRSIRKNIGEDGQESLYGVERIITPKKTVNLFAKNGLKVKSLRYFRFFSSRLGSLADKKHINLMALEKRLENMPLLLRIFSIHYNIVFRK